MTLKSLLYSFLSILIILSCAQSAQESLKEQINSEFNLESGKFAMAFLDLETNEQILINANEAFHAASTMKTPVMIELHNQAEAGNFSLDDSLLVKDEFYSIVDSSVFKMDIGEDSEARLYEKVGAKIPIKDLMFEMITMSSNLATNILIDLVDARKVTATMRELGAINIEVLRGVEDLKAFDQGLSNTTTALDLMHIYAKLAAKEVVSKEASSEMLKVLTAQHFNDIIPLKLPKDVTVAHKTGSITGVHHDSGIVYTTNGRSYVLILLSKEMKDFDKGTEMLAGVSRLVYEYFMNKT